MSGGEVFELLFYSNVKAGCLHKSSSQERNRTRGAEQQRTKNFVFSSAARMACKNAAAPLQLSILMAIEVFLMFCVVWRKMRGFNAFLAILPRKKRRRDATGHVIIKKANFISVRTTFFFNFANAITECSSKFYLIYFVIKQSSDKLGGF